MHIKTSGNLHSSRGSGRLNNMLGAFAVSLADAIETALSESTLLPEPLPAALIQIGSFSGHSSELLSKSIGLSQSATTRVIQKLQDKGFLQVETSSRDRRAIELKLTPQGERQRERALQAREKMVAGVTLLLTEKEQEQLVGLLERVFPVTVPDQKTSDYTCRYCDANCCPQESCPAETESATWKFNRKKIDQKS